MEALCCRYIKTPEVICQPPFSSTISVLSTFSAYCLPLAEKEMVQNKRRDGNELQSVRYEPTEPSGVTSGSEVCPLVRQVACFAENCFFQEVKPYAASDRFVRVSGH